MKLLDGKNNKNMKYLKKVNEHKEEDFMKLEDFQDFM